MSSCFLCLSLSFTLTHSLEQVPCGVTEESEAQSLSGVDDPEAEAEAGALGVLVARSLLVRLDFACRHTKESSAPAQPRFDGASNV